MPTMSGLKCRGRVDVFFRGYSPTLMNNLKCRIATLIFVDNDIVSTNNCIEFGSVSTKSLSWDRFVNRVMLLSNNVETDARNPPCATKKIPMPMT